MMTKTTQPGAEPANVFEDRATPGQWRVEWFDDDGRCELDIFSGEDARRQALRYAMRKYGQFREVLEEQSEAPHVLEPRSVTQQSARAQPDHWQS